jgi:enamine deaminase RidA (YjgF/YER057c/UK114 family)
MTLERIDPSDLPTPQTYSHVVAATGNMLVSVAGQVADDARGELVGAGDLAAQSRQAFANLGKALVAAGARPEQVVKITIFVARYRPDDLPAIEEGRVALFGDHVPTDTLVGAAALSDPRYLIEVDAIEVMDG